ncbi:hypothetical protein [Marinobacterium jannaschii]|uniref:hypothetical protein n=1 Tax=Marinobacterium jannaschii TaxID=64970 RepID=UPI0004858038|nr:hypothetical protein [Marinobacterium jannaschii]
MSSNDITEWLMSLDNEQLDRVQEVLQKKIVEKKEFEAAQKEKKMRSVPNYTSKVEDLAELQGLDLSGLMREIARR